MFRNLLLLCVFTVTACSLVAEHKYVDTTQYRDEAYRLCMASDKYSPATQQQRCRQDAETIIRRAEHDFREFRADEHNYRLCRSRYPDIAEADRCFTKQQDKYYKRELHNYQMSL